MLELDLVAPETVRPLRGAEDDALVAQGRCAGERVEPQPAVALRGVELAPSALRRDRALEGPLYAQAGAPEQRIVNLIDDLLASATT